METAMRSTAAIAFALMLGTLACSDSPSSPSGNSATFNLRLTDSPFSNAQAVLVTFSEVTAHRSDSDWSTLPFAGAASSRTCDLKKLQNSAQDLLGGGTIGPGTYTMIRLIVQSARIYFDNAAVSSTPCAASIDPPAGASSPLTIPSGEVKLNGSFNLTSTAATTVLLDFDGESSFSQTGNGSYMMNPVVRIVSVQ